MSVAAATVGAGSTMKCILVHRLGKAFKENLRMQKEEPIPTLALNSKPNQPKCLLIKVGACSISPLDTHQIDGDVSLVFKPPRLPWCPGGDVAGVVVESAPDSKFKVGDKVIATITDPDKKTTPFGAMAEYARVIESHTVKKPENLTFAEACHLTTSALTALKLADVANLGPKDRVVVTGATGGVGCFLMQLLRSQNPELLIAVSSNRELAKSLGADRVVNYKTENFWELNELQEKPLTTIIDCAGGRDFWQKGSKVLRSSLRGGRYLTIIGDERDLKITQTSHFPGFIYRMVIRPILVKFVPWWPNYHLVDAHTEPKQLERVVELAASGRLRVCQDPRGPFPFTEEGVREAYTTLHSHHTQGKIGVEMIPGA